MKRIKSINRPITDLIVHYSATPVGMKVDAEKIRQWHMRDRGWNDIGYHYVVLPDGKVQLGRDIAQTGAHCNHHNFESIGICYVGGLDEEGKSADTRTKEQKVALRAILTVLKSIFLDAKVYGHKDHVPTLCPGFDAKKEYMDITNIFEEPEEE